jgi:hypothetical protein
MMFAPLEGWRHVKVTDRHTAVERLGAALRILPALADGAAACRGGDEVRLLILSFAKVDLTLVHFSFLMPGHLEHSPARRLSVGCAGCNVCNSALAGYRLARLAVKFGDEILLDDLIVRLLADCPWRNAPRGSLAGELLRICRQVARRTYSGGKGG